MRATRPLAALVAAALAATSLLIGATAGASGPPSSTPTFDAAVPLAGNAIDVKAGDINGDGLPDLVTFNGDNSITIFTNGPAGSFTPNTVPLPGCALWSYGVGAAGIGIVCQNGDFLLLDSSGTQLASDTLTLDVLSGPADRVVATTSNGAPVIVVGIAPGSPSAGTLAIYSWTGSALIRDDIAVSTPVPYTEPVFSDLVSLEVAGDDALGWSIYDFGPSMTATIAVISGGAQVDVSQNPVYIPGIPSISVGDFNADGLDDILMVGTSTDGIGQITNLQQPDGSFAPQSFADIDAAVPALVSSPSFTGSCYSDFVVNALQGGATFLYSNNGSGAFEVLPHLDELTAEALDLNGDQRMDRVVKSGGAVSVMLQNALSPVFTAQPVTVAAVPAGESVTYSVATDPGVPPGTVQWQSAPGGTENWTDVPGAVGADYTFTAAPGDAGRRFRALVTTADGYSALSCPASLDRVDPALGGFLVTKAVDGDAAGEVAADVPFTIAYDYDTPDGQHFAGTFDVTRATPNGLDDLPPGTIVSLSEVEPLPAVAGVAWGGIQWSDDDLTIVSGETLPTTVTNTADEAPVGGFEVTKSVAGSGNGLVDDDVEFTVGYEYEGPLGHVEGTLVVSESTPNGLAGLPAGTEVTLSEPAFPSVSGVAWGTPVWSVDGVETVGTATLTIADDHTAEVILTNRADAVYGSFSVIKSLAGNGDVGNTSFRVDYSWDAANGFPGGGGTLLLAPGVVEQVTHIPPGVEVHLVEILPDIPGIQFGDPTWTGAEPDRANPLVARFAASTDGTDVAIGLRNIADGVPGSFTVTKSVQGGLDLGNTTFEVEYSFPGGGGFPGGSGSLTLEPNVPQTVDDVPPGVTVTLIEAVPFFPGVQFHAPGWTGANPVSGSPFSATFPSSSDGTDVVIGLENHPVLITSSFTVTKSVVGDGPAGNARYPVSYSWVAGANWPAGEGVLDLTPGVPQEVQNVPPGVTVILTETLPSIPGVAFGDPRWTGARVPDPSDPLQAIFVATSNGADVVIGLENQASAIVGDLSVTKEVTGAAASAIGGDFLFLVDYSYTDAGGVLREGVMPVSKNNPTRELQGLPVGTVVTLSERTATYPGVIFGEPIWSGDVFVDQGVVTVTIVGNETASVELENPAAPLPPLPPLAFTGTNAGGLLGLALVLTLAGGVALAVPSIRRRLVG